MVNIKNDSADRLKAEAANITEPKSWQDEYITAGSARYVAPKTDGDSAVRHAVESVQPAAPSWYDRLDLGSMVLPSGEDENDIRHAVESTQPKTR